MRGAAWGGRYRGQEQKWFAMRFLGRDQDIALDRHHPEFNAWRWVTPGELLALIVPFKRALYEARAAGVRTGPGAIGNNKKSTRRTR